MKQTKFFKTRLSVAISMLLGATTVAPVMAQEADTDAANDNVEIIEVSGIRGSLARSQDIKRDSAGVVDAISAEEMGKFPDTNLAESLQRITGVSVSRSNGEGSEITVRGFGPGFNLVTLNGRQMPGTGYTRSYDLANLSSEGVSTLEVHKTAKSYLPSGGLGATVNIMTTKPLNSPGFKYSASAKGIYDESNVKGDDVTPEFAAVISNTFLDDNFGVALSFSHQERDFQQQSANIQGWKAQSLFSDNSFASRSEEHAAREDYVGSIFLPQDVNYGINDVQRERTNGQLTLQYAITDDFIATVDYTATRVTVGSEYVGWGFWYGGFGGVSSFDYNENGTVTYMDVRADDGSFTANRATTDVEADSIGINLDWNVNEDFNVSFDYHDSSNGADNGADPGLGSTGQLIFGSNLVDRTTFDIREGDIPQIFGYWQNGGNEMLPSEIDHNFDQFIHSPGEATVEQFQLDVEWVNPYDFPLVSLKVGAAYTENFLEGSNTWSGLMGGPGFSPSYTALFPDNMFVRNSTAGFLDEFSGGGNDLATNYYYTFDYDEAISRAAANIPGYDPDFVSTRGDASILEETTSFYIASQWDFEVSEYLVQLNAGVRYEETDVTSRALQLIPLQVNWVAATEWITIFSDDQQYYVDQGENDVFLPSLDLKVDITDDLVGRISWGKTMARPNLGDLVSILSVSGSPKPGARTGGQGNTSLLPFESTNLDISLEYYYGEASYASIGYFKKDVENFVATLQSEETFEGLNDIQNSARWNDAVSALEGMGMQANETNIYNYLVENGFANADGAIEPLPGDPQIVWTISKPQNLDEKSVDGFEIAVQHMFGETGFGAAVNATFVDGDVEFDPTSFAIQSPLNGLSDSANVQAFYEDDELSVKFTYAWRDSYYAGGGQGQGSAGEPTQTKEFGQLDLSINYDIDENLTVFFEGINLTNEVEENYGRFEEQFLSARQYGTRYVLGARYSFSD
ncbi:TonB-dependent receptor [Planctobacterium marinum]|uniref:TonB-dependent receptor n=1 Tax=Planctobacterium marinum TaxID=1631968 RepID=A0AA48HYW3_9ALTE|nr:TonB-dependent receptor [Planctobacterium marinum]